MNENSEQYINCYSVLSFQINNFNNITYSVFSKNQPINQIIQKKNQIQNIEIKINNQKKQQYYWIQKNEKQIFEVNIYTDQTFIYDQTKLIAGPYYQRQKAEILKNYLNNKIDLLELE